MGRRQPKIPDLTLVYLAEELVHMRDAEEYQTALDIIGILHTRLAFLEQDIMSRLSLEESE